jgi:hypothetical protein
MCAIGDRCASYVQGIQEETSTGKTEQFELRERKDKVRARATALDGLERCAAGLRLDLTAGGVGRLDG